jgi:hypothetical protein
MAYNCQCISCGYTLTSTEHCSEIKCPRCGGSMRRSGRPGPGQPLLANTEPQPSKSSIWPWLLAGLGGVVLTIAIAKQRKK